MSMITASLWVKRGIPAAFPTRYDVDERELARISKLAKLQLDDAKGDLVEMQDAEDERGLASTAIQKEPEDSDDDDDSDGEKDGVKLQSYNGKHVDDDLKEYDMDNYDNDAGSTTQTGNLAMFGDVRSLAVYDSNADDPYITIKEGDGEDDEEREELQILPTDNMMVAAKVEDEVPYLEVYVYEDEADNLYVHHDIMLPAVPLCLEWFDFPVSREGAMLDGEAKGNLVAVGTMEPDIELWNLDVVDLMYPSAILGQGGEVGEDDAEPKASAKKKKKKHKSKKPNEENHVDAVLSLAANRHHRHLLASASADKTIKLWDLNATKCVRSSAIHTDKVCSLAWHSTQSSALLSGSYDRTAVVADMEDSGSLLRWRVTSDIETVMWDPHNDRHFYVSTEHGMLHLFDVRHPPTSSATNLKASSNAVWSLQAHDEALSCMDVHSTVPGFIATGSSDQTVKLWNVRSSEEDEAQGKRSGGPSMVVSRQLGVGEVFSTRFAPDREVGFRLAVAGSKGALQIWDTSTNGGVRRAFVGRMKEGDGPVLNDDSKEERVVGLVPDEENDDEAEGEEAQGTNGAMTQESTWVDMEEEVDNA